MTMGYNPGGPTSSVDNGDGTFTFQFADGRAPVTAAGPFAKQTHDRVAGMDLVAPKEDERTAAYSPIAGVKKFWEEKAEPVVSDVGYRAFHSPQEVAARDAARQPDAPAVGGGPRLGTTTGGEVVPASAASTTAAGEDRSDNHQLLPGQQPQRVDPASLSFGSPGGMGGFGAPMIRVPGTKGGWQDVSRETKPGYQASEQVQTARQAAQGLEQEAADKQHSAQQSATDFAMEATAKRAETVGRQLAEDDARMSQQQQQVQAKQAELDKMSEDLRTEKTDPSKFWKEQGAVGTIGMALAAAAGGFAQGLTGAPNNALNTINRMVDQNIAAQESNRAHRKEMLAEKRQGFRELQNTFKTQNEQQAAHRVLMWDSVQAQLDAQKAHLGPAFDEAAYTQMSAGIAEKRATAMAGFEKEAQNATVLHSRYIPPQRGGIVQAPPGKFEHNLYVPQFGGVAPTEKEAQDARAAGATQQDLDRLAQENVRLRGNPESFVPGTQAHAALASNQSTLVLKLKDAEKLGALSGPDQDLAKGALGDGTSIAPGQSAALKTYVANAAARNAHVRQNLGIIPVQVQPYMDPKTGQIKMGQQYAGGPSSPVAAPDMTERGR